MVKFIITFIIFFPTIAFKGNEIKANENFSLEIDSLILIMKKEKSMPKKTNIKKKYLATKVDSCSCIISIKEGINYRSYVVNICEGMIERYELGIFDQTRFKNIF